MVNILKRRDIGSFKKSIRNLNYLPLLVKHRLLSRQFVKRNRIFFSWFFNIAFWSTIQFRSGWRSERLGVQRPGRFRFNQARQRSIRTPIKVGPKLNLRANALVARLCKHGQRGSACRMIEEMLRVVGELIGGDVSPIKVLNSVLAALEPPFEIKLHRRRWGVLYYPIPIWPRRKYFLAAKILVCGAKHYQKQHQQPFVLALAQEVVATFTKKSDGFSRKVYRKLIRLGLRNKFRWRRLVHNL